ncbi:cupin domain-containing protein [Herbidospora solisilvae]|uniref:cupin domain-containing protein n=1 Tax=Herbidospora solisilvae TaxID=2696284 RepID=UPI0019298E74|nr:cupin domain-containing protein [Herbidospora solisilvae]
MLARGIEVLPPEQRDQRAGGVILAFTLDGGLREQEQRLRDAVVEPPWGMRLSGSIQLGVHAVVRGRGWLWTDTPGSAVELSPGTVVLVRGGPDHYVGDQPGAHCVGPEEFGARHPLTEAG